MSLLDKLFAKKKPVMKAKCPITKEPIEPGFGYLLTTAQVTASKKYWDMVMTEPETMSYTISHFKNQENGTRMRGLIFEKFSTVNKPWIISDSCINLFEDIDKKAAKEAAKKWWETEGHFIPDQSGSASDNLEPTVYQTLKSYAILEAGRSRLAHAS
jgi:hypothetical protein